MKTAYKGKDYSAKGKGRRVWLRLCRRMVRKSRPPKGGRRHEFIYYSGWILTDGKGSKKQEDGKAGARPTLQTKRVNRFEMLCHNVDTLQRAAVRLVQTIPRYERPKRPLSFQVLKRVNRYLSILTKRRA